MAQSPANPQQLSAQSPANPSIGTPPAPAAPPTREQQRISLLLSINVELLAEVNRLQLEGHGGAISNSQRLQLQQSGADPKMASEEYVQCLRRVQANLAYMMPKAQKDESKQHPGPAHMTPPRHMPALREKYEQLRELFPGWLGVEGRMMAQGAGSPGAVQGQRQAQMQGQVQGQYQGQSANGAGRASS